MFLFFFKEIEPKCGEMLCRQFDLNEPDQTELSLNLQSIIAKSKQRHADLAHEIENRHQRSERNSRSRSTSRDARHSKSPSNNSNTNSNRLNEPADGDSSNQRRNETNNRKDYYSRQQHNNNNSFRLAYQIILV